MILVNFENHITDDSEQSYIDLISKVTQHILLSEGCTYDSEVSVILTDDEEIRQTNLSFREIDKATDVLSFPNFDFNTPANFSILKDYENDFDYFNPENKAFYLGDIMISDVKARLQAEEYGHSYTREFAFLIAHSILHLIGYDHMTTEEATVMEEKQRNYLNELGITREADFDLGTNHL